MIENSKTVVTAKDSIQIKTIDQEFFDYLKQ